MFTYFKLTDFDSPDAPGSGKIMNLDLLYKLDYARKIASIPFVIISGVHTAMYNSVSGEGSYSSHLSGHEADILYNSSTEAEIIIDAAMNAGIRKIGIDLHKIHLDNNPLITQPVLWRSPNVPAYLIKKYFPHDQSMISQ